MTATNCILLDCEYFPCIAWFQKFINYEKVVIEQHEYFVRTSLRNRCYIAGANGKLALSIPLKGGRNQKTLMKDMQVSFDTDWQTLHWKTIESAYRRSPFFEYYEMEFKKFFSQKHQFLIDWNLESLQLISQLLQLKKDYVLTNEYQTKIENTCLDLRNEFMAHAQNEQIIIPTYLQTFMNKHGFQSNLSIMDMLFCEGKALVKML